MGGGVTFYAPNFEKVGRAYCFRLVCVSVFLSVCLSVCVRPLTSILVHVRNLKFHMCIPHEKIVEPYLFHV